MGVHDAFVDDRHDNGRVAPGKPPRVFHGHVGSFYSCLAPVGISGIDKMPLVSKARVIEHGRLNRRGLGPYRNIFLDTGRNFARCLPDDFVVLYLGDIVTPGQFRGHTFRGNFRRESGDIPSFEVFVLNAFEKGFETDIAFGITRHFHLRRHVLPVRKLQKKHTFLR